MERCGFLQSRIRFLTSYYKKCNDGNSFLNFVWLYNFFKSFISVVISVCMEHKDRY